MSGQLRLHLRVNTGIMVITSIMAKDGNIYQSTTRDTALLNITLTLWIRTLSLVMTFIALRIFLQLSMRIMALTSITTKNYHLYRDTTRDTALFRIILPHLIQALPQVVSSIACVHIYTLTDIWLTAPTSISPEFVQGNSSGVHVQYASIPCVNQFTDVGAEENHGDGPSPCFPSCWKSLM